MFQRFFSQGFIQASLAAFCVLNLSLSAMAAPDGTWNGAIQLPGLELYITVRLKLEGGQWSGQVDIPQQNAKNLPLEKIEVQGNKVRFQIKGVPGNPYFEGELFLDETELSGQFAQGGQNFPFKLQRPDSPAVLEAAKAQQERLDRLKGWIQKQMEYSETPGLAVGIIKDDQVIFRQGFGQARRDKNQAVDPETRFAIGSTTKAMTAMLLGILVDERRLRWEQPVYELLPDFRLKDSHASEALTVWDLLQHNSGLPRHDLLWYGTHLSREQLYQRLRYLEPSADLRERFQYNNLMYMTAGILAGKVAGSSWEELIESRLFQPLNMKNASPSGPMARSETENYAQAYARRKAKVQAIPYRNAIPIGPAGSVFASLDDMLQWLRLHLNGGEVDGKRLISAETLAQLHSPQIVMAPQVKAPMTSYMLYGSGWMIYPYRGHHVLQHGGNIDGFTAQVALLPEQRLGLVILSNLDKDPLPALTMNTVLDRFLGLESMNWENQLQKIKEMQAIMGDLRANAQAKVPHTRPSHPLQDYVGVYGNGAYEDFRITHSGNSLKVHYGPLQGTLKHFHYDTFEFESDTGEFDGFFVHFEPNLAGDVAQVRVQLESQLPAFILERQAEPQWRKADYLKEVAGRYQIGPQIFTLHVLQDKLMATTPGQPDRYVIPLGSDRFRIENWGFHLRLERKAGKIIGGILIQPGGSFHVKRLPD